MSTATSGDILLLDLTKRLKFIFITVVQNENILFASTVPVCVARRGQPQAVVSVSNSRLYASQAAQVRP